jgi:hypothetical protein
MRSKFAYKKIAFKEIHTLKLKKHTGTKHPIRLTLFGLTLLVSVFLLFSSHTIEPTLNLSEDADTFSAAKAYGAVMTGVLFLMFLGSMAILQAIWPRWMILVKLQNNSNELLPLKEIIKKKQVKELVDFLVDSLNTTQFQFQERLLKKHLT